MERRLIQTLEGTLLAIERQMFGAATLHIECPDGQIHREHMNEADIIPPELVGEQVMFSEYETTEENRIMGRELPGEQYLRVNIIHYTERELEDSRSKAVYRAQDLKSIEKRKLRKIEGKLVDMMLEHPDRRISIEVKDEGSFIFIPIHLLGDEDHSRLNKALGHKVHFEEVDVSFFVEGYINKHYPPEHRQVITDLETNNTYEFRPLQEKALRASNGEQSGNDL